MHKQDILLQIEKKREELVHIVKIKGLTSALTVQYSQELDHLLNLYDQTYTSKLNNLT